MLATQKQIKYIRKLMIDIGYVSNHSYFNPKLAKYIPYGPTIEEQGYNSWSFKAWTMRLSIKEASDIIDFLLNMKTLNISIFFGKIIKRHKS